MKASPFNFGEKRGVNTKKAKKRREACADPEWWPSVYLPGNRNGGKVD